MDEGCIFCKIVAGKAVANKQAETEDYIVIPDVSPQAPVHLLFVSKVHGEELASVEQTKLMRMLEGVRGSIATHKLTESSYRTVINGAAATLVHNHLHIHLLGNVTNDRPV